jgi:hypothetical protein
MKARGYIEVSRIPFDPDSENRPNEGTEHLETVVMQQRIRGKIMGYVEINPDGSIN